jgi:phosphatidylinositol glycan class B
MYPRGELTEPAAAPGTSNRLALTLVLAVAAALRLFAAFTQPNIIWPDEVFQVVEPAHRLVYGNGIIAWEQVVGMRSWLFPGVIAAVLWVARLFGPGQALGIIPVQLFMVACSLVPVGVAYRWGERLGGVRDGAVVGGVVALWVDLIYFAPHPLSDVIAGDVLMGGLYAALPLTTLAGVRRLAFAGALFGLALVLRIQLGPALLVAAAFACGRRPRAWFALVCGAAAVLLASGALDWITLGAPFRPIWLNLWLNTAKGISDYAAAQPLTYYLAVPVQLWWPVSIAVLSLFVVSRRRFPALFWTVAALFLTLTVVPHKEWRYFYPGLAPLIALCGIVTIDAVRMGERYLGKLALPSLTFTTAALAIWSAASLFVAIGPRYASNWTSVRETIDAFALASRQPGVCGVGLVDISWDFSPGSAALPPGTPIYVSPVSTVRHDAASYNVAITDRVATLPADLYRRTACFDGSLDASGRPRRTACVWVRSGGCTPGAANLPAPNWPPFFLDRQGKPRLDRIAAYSL